MAELKWKLSVKADFPNDASTEDSADSSTSPSCSGRPHGKSSPHLRFGFLPHSRNDLINTFRIRSSSIDSMSICGWDFLLGRRRPRWQTTRRSIASRRPFPHLYVDEESRLDLVTDVCKLRRGDHCVIVLNVFRTMNPYLDHIHSWLSGYGYFRMFHHFLVLDDVVDIDSNGVPRNEDGIACEILEYSNTASQFLEEAKHRGFIANLLDKAKCRRVALIDNGDNRYFYRFNDTLDDAQRDLIVQRAIDFIHSQPKYHLFYQNCEHTTNLITMKDLGTTSALVEYVFGNSRRYILHIVFTILGMLLLPAFLVTLGNVLLIQRQMIKSMSGIDLMKRVFRFVIVSVVSAVSIHLALSSDNHVSTAALVVSHAYWFCDTIVFNTLVNMYAIIVYIAS